MDHLEKLRVPTRCSLFVSQTQQCEQPAYWLVNGAVMCDGHIQGMADMNGENEEFLRPALDDKAALRLRRPKCEITRDVVPSPARPYWEGCSTRVALLDRPGHTSLPPWFTNKIYDYRTGQTWWQFFVNAVGLQEAVRQRQAFLDGHRDVRGNYWCGSCYQHMLLINLGERLGYPDAHTLYALKETREMIGYEAWLHLAREGGDVLVGMLVDGIRAKYSQVMWQELQEVLSAAPGGKEGE